MELVMDLVIIKRSSLPLDGIVRGCMILAIIGILCIGSWNYEKGCAVRYEGDMVSPKAGVSGFNQSINVLKSNAEEIFEVAGADRGILTEIQGMEIGLLVQTESEPIALPSAGDKRDVVSPTLLEEDEPVRILPVVKEGSEILLVVKEVNEMPAAGEEGKEDTTIINEDEKGAADKEKEVDTEGTGESGESGESGIKEISGFLVDTDGYITGVTENLNLIDDILVFPWDEGCIGIRAGALSGLAGCVGEIYIPSNIREIEPGALDELAPLAYIEAAEDHPCYYSEDGILYPR